MNKNSLFLTVILAISTLPLTGQGAAGYLYESDTSTDSILQFTTTASGTLLKTTFASGLTGLRGIAFNGARDLFAAQEDGSSESRLTVLRVSSLLDCMDRTSSPSIPQEIYTLRIGMEMSSVLPHRERGVFS